MRKKIRIVDLFCGMGGLSIGAIQAIQESNKTPEIQFACDYDQDASFFYQKNFAKYLKKYHYGDISEVLSDNFSSPPNTQEQAHTSLSGKIDFLFAGPPCQGHSNLNNHSRRKDPRNFLYLRTIRFIELTKPTYFLIENVPAVVHAEESIVSTSTKLLEKFGYEITESVIDFTKLGVPQSRKRHVIFGSLKHDLSKILSNIYTDKKVLLSDVLEDLLEIQSTSIFDTASKMNKENMARANYLFDTNSYDLPNELRPKCHQGNHSYKSMYGRLKWNEVAQTITSGFGSMGQGRYLHPQKRRVITPHEAARIQGLPDWLDYSEIKLRSNLQKMIGNAVPPALSRRFVQSAMEK
ncbi:DNA cytosine methyltransferase [Stutzerimonas nitrititolerans]|uniref:DNA cytosine methyltransferase n=1 Tax=Stutzerimonas nitrititolerans TaxID=2482751 RepID=UPI0028ABC9E5|nr:DNA cytosine methyltransferase [Stutzerimonas nitrititolerans]